MLVEALQRDRLVAHVGRQRLQRGEQAVPLVERRLQRRRDVAGIGMPGEVVRHDHQSAVAPVLQAGEFHARSYVVA